MSSIASSTEIDFAPEELSSNKWFGDWRTSCKVTVLKAASLLTGPVCKVREYFYSFYTLSETCRNTVEKVARAGALALGIVVCTFLTPFTAPLGIALRGVVVLVQSEPYIYLARAKEGKALGPDRRFSFVFHNECYMPAGYSITDGQVTPPSDKKRMDANVKNNMGHNPDLIALCEVPDIYDAEYLSRKYADYPFIIPVAGMRAVGPSSALYLVSKYKIPKESIRFIPFVKDVEITGRARFAEKGYLACDLISQGDTKPFVTIVMTHLQHSEAPAKPIDQDMRSRALQMDKIYRFVQEKVAQGGNVLFFGDLNQEERELNEFFKSRNVQWLRDPSVEGKPTWGGDAWCAKFDKKEASGPLVLDYAFAAGEGIKSISTEIFETGYRSDRFIPEATSDHYGLYNVVQL